MSQARCMRRLFFAGPSSLASEVDADAEPLLCGRPDMSLKNISVGLEAVQRVVQEGLDCARRAPRFTMDYRSTPTF